jgi:hypothetical protein
MKVAIALALLLAGCGPKVRLAVEFPTAPDLSAETVKPCPPAAAVTGELGDLAVKDAALAIEYARCQARQATAVGAYQTLQRLLRAAQAEADRISGAKSPTSAR